MSIPCASCSQPTTIALVVTSRTGESSLCWRCWKPQAETARREQPLRRDAKPPRGGRQGSH